MIAVSLNVGGSVRLIKLAKLCMCRQNTTNTRRTDTQRRGVHGNGSVPLSHSENVVTRIGIHTHTHKLSYEIWFQMTQQLLRKTSFNFEIRVTFCQGQIMTFTFDTHFTSLTHLFDCLTNFEAYGCNSFQIIHKFHFCQCKSLCDQI